MMRTWHRSWGVAWVAALVSVWAAGTAQADVFNNVEEAADFTLVYDLNIPNESDDFGSGVPYTVNNAASITTPFDRIAYYLELQTSGGNLEWVYVSVDSFTRDVSKIGVPAPSTGAFFQRGLLHMNVRTNVPSKVTAGDDIATGNIEFWSNCYGYENLVLVPGASETTYDFGDDPSHPASCYGSMQIHNHGLGQTLFAYNAWSHSGTADDVGIGNNGGAQPDWTHMYNAAGYTVKRLQVLVRKSESWIGFIPEARGYDLVYELPIPSTAGTFHPSAVPYSINRSASVPGNFARVAYYLELQEPGGPVRYVWTSMDAFATSASQIGVPASGVGVSYQQNVTNLTVVSNQPGVTNGSFATAGNIEFWPNNYGTTNTAGVPNASNDYYDTGDFPTSPTAGYGCMQVHNHTNNQVIWAYNAWGTTSVQDLGIGNSPTGSHADWTFRYNASNYIVKTLQVYAQRPPSARDLVPEAADYTLVYDLNIPTNGGYGAAVPYALNFANDIGTFDRVAYLLELQTSGGSLEWVYVSMDAFTDEVHRIGVPSSTGALFQQNVTNMNVFTNVPTKVTAGTGIATGNIEFWDQCYEEANSGGVPNASDTTYDVGDGPDGRANCYGSMQVHNHATGTVQTLLAYNTWAQTGVSSVGIGNAPSGQPDWTFANNAAGFTVRRMQVLVRETDLPLPAEAANYELVYELPIPGAAANYNSVAVPYSIDRSALIDHPFGRVAYYLYLQRPGEAGEWVWASMDAFSDDAALLGVPTPASGAIFQQNVDNLHVETNASTVTAGDYASAGNIEFWPHCYRQNNGALVPNASDTLYDTGDEMTGSNCYGTLQVHNHELNQVLLAYNAWDTNSIHDVGIGPAPSGEPDWTFWYNADDYAVKTLRVYVSREPDVYDYVPESEDYTLVYELDIPVEDNDFPSGVPYTVDNSATVGAFDRIAYFLELQDTVGNLKWVYASMDAFTDDATLIGVPVASTGAQFQQNVDNMNVFTNAPTLVTAGTGITTGNIEFWSLCYGRPNSAGVPNASDTLYDVGDEPTSGDNCYGSMQIHNHVTGNPHTLFSYSGWGHSSGSDDLGIGNNGTGTGDPDWTFAYNSGSYGLRRLQVLVRERATNLPAEADSYDLVYLLDVPTTAVDYRSTPVPYTVDNSDLVTYPFERVGYFVELQTAGGSLEWVWVSMDAFTQDADLIGVPTAASGASFQQEITNMHVYSNVATVTEGVYPDAGNLEFWPYCYGTTNTAGVPNASSDYYDTGDYPTADVCYGSMQVHNHELNEVLFAYNAWNHGGIHDLGIGPCPTGSHPDWTFRYNANTYSVRSIAVYVLPGEPSAFTVTAPVQRTLLQRDATNMASLDIAGTHLGAATLFEAQAVPRSGFGGVATGWQVIDAAPGAVTFAGTLDLVAGWYDIEVRAYAGETLLDTRSVQKVGVGDIFITAGQSNSANHGSPRQTPQDERVLAHDLVTNWRLAADPQPIATGSDGTPWPDLGDILAERYDIPIGFVSVGWGGTSVAQWLPASNDKYPRLQNAVNFFGPNGFRAILWHQGETDNANGMATATYATYLQTVLDASRVDAGFDAPWGIALVSYTPANGSVERILNAQRQVIAQDPYAFEGAYTDDLIGSAWRYDGIHFNDPGLYEHALRWANSMDLSFCADGLCNGSETCDSCPADCGDCCGDASCDAEYGETCDSCPADCGDCCGNGSCDTEYGETCDACPADCGDCCGNGNCDTEFGETCFTCEADCDPCCGNGSCEGGYGEDCDTCASDCGECCGNGTCDGEYGEDCGTCEADCGACCGDGTCEAERDETCDTCASDCGECCGNGTCDGEYGEDCGTCEADCGACCGDGQCESERGETCDTCSSDCGECCGNGLCEVGYGEDCGTCESDCGACCGDGTCEAERGEDCGTCESDCGACCGDGSCEPARGETCDTCASDCGECCGDGLCDAERGEDCGTCEDDCGACCGDGLCDAERGEDCGTCEDDCGACCGDGLCEAERGEHCGSCPADCGAGCDDGNACTTDTCDPDLGCQYVNLPDGTSCGDTNACNGAETCEGGTCVFGPAPTQGDVNADGAISAGDAQTAFYIALGSYQATPAELCAADCNGDGTVSAGDAQLIFYTALGSGSCVPPR